VEFVILGHTALLNDGAPVLLGAANERGLLSLLALYAGQPVRMETLVECLWTAGTPAAHRRSIYTLVSRLRSRFTRHGIPVTIDHMRSVDAYRMQVNPAAVDIHLFRSRIMRSRWEKQEARHEAAVATLQEALGLWRGEPIPDVRGARAAALREQLVEELLTARKMLAEILLETGRNLDALDLLEDLLRDNDNDLDEAIARLWITALHEAGRSEDARRYFAAFRPRFRRANLTEPDIDIVGIMSRRPAPSAPEIHPRQLPNTIKDFTGRTDALRELDRLTRPDGPTGDVAVVTGMPGIGKTTLALHWAQHNLDRYPDGQIFVAVQTYSSSTPFDPHAALARILDALGIPFAAVPATLDQRRDLFNRLLDGRRMLIVLDDVGRSEQARPLIPTAPGCLTLITSRHTLGQLAIRDAVPTLTAEPLATADSTTLLARLIGGPRIEREPEALTRLAKAAAGHPLALRIIGNHVLERPLASIADLVDDLRNHLFDPAGDDDQVTLDTVFSWSYRALSAETATLFRRLAQHPGASIGVEIAAAMSQADPDVAKIRLNALAKAHLIGHDTARHYRFHDLLRIYAGKCAVTEDSPATITTTRIRALDWYLHSATNATAMLFPESPPVPDLPPLGDRAATRFASDAEALRWYDLERENLVAATRSAARHGLDRLTWQIQGALHQIAYHSGKLDGLLELDEIAVAAARRDNHPAGEIGHLLNIGAVHMAQRRHSLAEAAAARALKLARESNPEYEVICTYSVAMTFMETGRTDEAVQLFHRALEMSRSTFDGEGETYSLLRLGDIHHHQGDLETAVTFFRQSLEVLHRIGASGGYGSTHNRLARLYLEMDQLSSAVEHCERALQSYERTKDEKKRAETLAIRADIHRRSAATVEAISDARRASEIATEIGDASGYAGALAVLTDALADAGSHGEAATAASQGLQILDKMSGSDVPALRRRLLLGYTSSLRASGADSPSDGSGGSAFEITL
jgi:tetratricopeptide (TPR) repeat protein